MGRQGAQLETTLFDFFNRDTRCHWLAPSWGGSIKPEANAARQTQGHSGCCHRPLAHCNCGDCVIGNRTLHIEVGTKLVIGFGARLCYNDRRHRACQVSHTLLAA